MEDSSKSQSPSIMTASSSSSWSSPQPEQPESPSWKYYRSIYQLPLNRFIDVQVDKNVYALVISGTPPLEALLEAWEAIKLEAADKAGNLEYRMYRSLFRDINALKNTIDLVRELVAILRETYVAKFARRLNELLVTSFVFDVTNPADYDKLLTRCYNMTGGLQLRLDLLQRNYKAIEAKFEGNKEPDRDYYLSLLITLSDNAGYALPESITVFEFYERMARATEKVKKLKNRKHGR